MKVHGLLIFKVTCLLCIIVCNGESDVVDGELVAYSAPIAELYCPVGVYTDVKCLDCFTKAFCDGLGNAVLTPCPSTARFCHQEKNICSTVRDDNFQICDDQLAEEDLTCTGEGYFPDPLNCQLYYFCPDPTVKPVVPRATYTCPANYVYDSVNFVCKRKVLGKDCLTVACTKANSFVTYPGNANYYGYCQTATSTPLLFKCATGHYFNLTTFGCEFVCPAVGSYLGANCRQWYDCYTSGTKILAKPQSCPSGYLWSTTTKNCQRDTAGTCTA